MKRFNLHLIVTSFHFLPIVFSVKARSSNSSMTTTIQDHHIQQAMSASILSPKWYLEVGGNNTTLAVNSSVSMTCRYDANVSKNFIWWFDGSILAGPTSTPAGLDYHNINVSKSNKTSILRLNALQWNNTGLYKCNVGKTTVMQNYLTVEDLRLRISCPNSECYQVFAANESQNYLLRCYSNQIPLHESITWKINNSPSRTFSSQTELNNSLNDRLDNMYLASTLIYTAEKEHRTVMCSMGDYSTNITVEVLYEDENYLSLIILAVGIMVLILILCITMGIVYCIWKRKAYPQSQNSVLSFSNEQYENGGAEQLNIQPDISKSNDEGPPLTPVSDGWKRLCEQHNQLFGLKLLSCRHEDKMDVFSEAVFVDGDYKERFVVRSVSGKSTIESLEDFRKFQNRLTELTYHPNVLEVLGCYTNRLPYRICYEYFPNKTVRDNLFEDFQNLQNSKMHDLQAQKLLCIAHGVANGIFYLKANQLDHVALRVEKVLYFGATICKLYDFSLRNQSEKKAKNLLEKSESLAWLGPDMLLRNEYNHLTDIWAFGVLMWELWSGGQMPFERSPRLTMEMNMRNEKMLQQPANCPGVVYSLMLSCWKTKPSERSSYRDIVTELENLKTSNCKNVIEDYDEASFPGPSFYTALDETTYDHLSTM